MRRLMAMAVVAAVAAGAAACANSPMTPDSATLASADGGVMTTAAKGGGGGKPGGGGTTSGGGSLSVVLSTDVLNNGVINRGDTVTYDWSTSSTTEPTVDLNCYQKSNLVLSATTGFYASYPWPSTHFMVLASG